MDDAIKGQLTVTDLKSEVSERFPKTKRGKDRKKKTVIETENEDTEETIIRKLGDCVTWFERHQPMLKMKGTLETLYKVYRRNWASGRKQK